MTPTTLNRQLREAKWLGNVQGTRDAAVIIERFSTIAVAIIYLRDLADFMEREGDPRVKEMLNTLEKSK